MKVDNIETNSAFEAAGALEIKCGKRTRNYGVNTDATDSQVFTALLKLMTVALLKGL